MNKFYADELINESFKMQNLIVSKKVFVINFHHGIPFLLKFIKTKKLITRTLFNND